MGLGTGGKFPGDSAISVLFTPGVAWMVKNTPAMWETWV